MIMFRVNGIGIWYRILAAISNLSVLTNVNIINSIIDQKNRENCIDGVLGI